MDLPNPDTYPEIGDLARRVTAIEQLLLDNKIHESFCPAHGATSDSFSNMFALTLNKQCVCWISLANPHPEEDKGYGLYDLKTNDLASQLAFKTRADAFRHLMNTHDELTTGHSAEYYWGKLYAIVEVTIQKAPDGSNSDS